MESALIDEDQLLGLTPYEVALYGHFKRVCGAEPGGMCWKSVSTPSKETGMSAGRVSEARAELARRGLLRTTPGWTGAMQQNGPRWG